MNKHIHPNRRLLLIFFLSAFFLVVFDIPAQKQKYQNLQEALFSSGKLNGRTGPRNVNWINEGEQFSYVKNNAQSGNQEIRSFTPKNGKDDLIFDGDGLKFPGTDQKFQYASFQWSDDSKYILFQSNFRPVWRRSGISDFYFYSISDKTLKLVAKDAQTAELSPNGKMIGYERGGNLFVFDFATQKETQLTNDAKDNFYNGRFGWVYEEEFGLAQAWSWSHDSKNIAFWQVDEREVPIFQMTDYSGQHAEYVKVRYPKVGDTNPTVKIGVIDITKNTKKWMDVDLNDGYIPRIYWTAEEDQLAIIHLNRKQTHLTLTFHDTKTGKGKKIMEERSDKWIDIFDFFAGINHLFFFPKDLKEFFWVSDRNGWSHMYRYDYTGKQLSQVTRGEWEVVIVHSVDVKRKTIYYSSTEKSPTERHLYTIGFDGNNKKRITQTDGRHRINFSPNGKYYIDRYSNVDTPTQVELWTTRGKMLEKFEANDEVSQYINEHAYAPKELIHFKTSDGQELDGYVIKPIDFDPGKSYPLVLNIYGGPGAQSVYNEFATNTWEQYLAQEGYVIASVNNRGSGGYGSVFEKVVYEDLGKWESHDFVETAKYLASLPWVDGDNMAIRGHSYGGYMSSFTTLYHPGIFKVALVGAPVTDWRLYDTIYTERYMGLKDENEENYKKSAPTTHAGNLEGKMFIAHSAMDENVHMQNTMQLVKALIDNGKDVDLRIYPPGAHGVAYNGKSYVLLYQQYVDYLNKYLK
ncbi:DPP IV N-terminal domain-containing protein [Fulvivirgaceae bacterium BMA10]|uniref:DPP IV N-terminal domain-containing protein n=1 Tax=Splendidivirga corallicola TaxID=3051826 RepID=A0ABT8KH56_9BACT|nr:DPP IV N-terminal domain-containing protein [Fulvivirgaceae bacterium BMA10]